MDDYDKVIIIIDMRTSLTSEKNYNVFDCLLVFIAFTLASGILGLPNSFEKTGILFGNADLFIGFATFLGFYIAIIYACEDYGQYHYGSLLEVLYNKFVAYISLLAVLGYCIPLLCYYQKDALFLLRGILVMCIDSYKDSEKDPNMYTCVTLLVIIYLLLCYIGSIKRIMKLKYCAIIIIANWGYLLVLNLTRLDKENENVKIASNDESMIFSALWQVLHAFYATHCIPVIFDEVQVKKKKILKRTVIIGTIFILILYVIVGNMGYLFSRSKISDFQLITINPSFSYLRSHNLDVFLLIGMFSEALSLLCSTLFVMYPARLCLNQIIYGLNFWANERQHKMLTYGVLAIPGIVYIATNSKVDIINEYIRLVAISIASLISPALIVCRLDISLSIKILTVVWVVILVAMGFASQIYIDYGISVTWDY